MEAPQGRAATWGWWQYTVKQVNFAGNVISQKVQIREIKLPQNCEFKVDNNRKF